MFFDEYDRFLSTSETAVDPLRLELRHQAIVVKMFDWAGLLADRPDAKSVSTYARGQRVTWLCAMR